MQTIEYRHNHADKLAQFGNGPWIDEPDKVQWPDEATGLPCIVKRSRYGAWCGYVGVSESHPYFQTHYNDVSDIEVHCGLTFSDFCQPYEPGEEVDKICHVVEDGENDRVWWLGFDCGHTWDIQPGMEKFNRDRGMPELMQSSMGGEYRTIDFVRNQCRLLAATRRRGELRQFPSGRIVVPHLHGHVCGCSTAAAHADYFGGRCRSVVVIRERVR